MGLEPTDYIPIYLYSKIEVNPEYIVGMILVSFNQWQGIFFCPNPSKFFAQVFDSINCYNSTN